MIRPNRKRVVESETKGPIPRVWQKPLALALGIAVLVMWLMEGTEITQYVRMANELERMNEEIAELKQTNSPLEKEIDLILTRKENCNINSDKRISQKITFCSVCKSKRTIPVSYTHLRAHET